MLKFLSSLRSGQRAQIRDARQIYDVIMKQSRNSAFFSPNLFADNYDGRMEVLCLHLSVILHSLRRFGENGERLSQAIYDVMIADFDIALREEGLSDTGVARRIKPLAKMFFSRAKIYSDVFQNGKNIPSELGGILQNYLILSHGNENVPTTQHHMQIVTYVENFNKMIRKNSLGEIAQVKFTFPELN